MQIQSPFLDHTSPSDAHSKTAFRASPCCRQHSRRQWAEALLPRWPTARGCACAGAPGGRAPAQEGPAGEDSDAQGRDEEMEAELAHSVSGDPLAAFDVEVQAEGQAIQQYLAMLQAARASATP